MYIYQLKKHIDKHGTMESVNEGKIREIIRKVIKEGLSDGTIKWENNRQRQSEVLGYKLTGKSDHKVKPNKLVQQVGFRKNI